LNVNCFKGIVCYNQIYDTSGNSVLKTGDGESTNPATFVGEYTRPNLLGFTVNADYFLYLYFDKPMNVSSLQINQIHIQDYRVGFTRSVGIYYHARIIDRS